MLTLLIRTILIYVIVTAAVRVMGKRQVSDMQTSELVITLIISEVASLPLENAERPLLNSLVPIMMIVAIELLVSLLMMKSRKVRSLICGHPIVIIKDGKMLDDQLKKLRISREDVYSLLREKNISDESSVRWGIIEPNGTLSALTDEDVSDNEIKVGQSAIDERMNRYVVHPDSGKAILGFQIPKWEEAKSFVVDLANVLPELKYCGWDLALTNQGWVMVEANGKGLFIGFQMPTQEGFRVEFEVIKKRCGYIG